MRTALLVVLPCRGLVRGFDIARFRIVRLGGPKVREAPSNAADPLDGTCFCIVTPLLLLFWT